MLRKQKETVLASLTEDLKNYNIIYLVDYQGLNVAQATELRNKLRDSGAKMRVVKNTLMKLACQKAQQETIPQELLRGSSALILSKDDPVSPAKIVKQFQKENEKPQIKAIVVDDVLYGPEKFAEFASLPGLNELRAKLVGSISSPIYGLVFTLSALLRGFVVQLDKIAKQKQQNS